MVIFGSNAVWTNRVLSTDPESNSFSGKRSWNETNPHCPDPFYDPDVRFTLKFV